MDTDKANVIEAMEIFVKAARNLNNVIQGEYEEYSYDNYPFEREFTDMCFDIEEWGESFCENIRNGVMRKSYTVNVYASEVVPQWKDDSNLFYVEFDGKVLYEWFLKNKAIKGDAEDFNRFMQEEATADMMVGAYDYCDSRSGVISVVKGLEVII